MVAEASFVRASVAAASQLARIAPSLVGRVYVYRGEPFEWRVLLQRLGTGCLHWEALRHAMSNDNHGGHFHFAEQMLAADAPWTTRNASTAQLMVVPALLGAGPFWQQHVNRTRPGCSSFTFDAMVDRLARALRSSPFWGRVPHLFVSGHYNALAQPAKDPTANVWGSHFRLPTHAACELFAQPLSIVAHFEMDARGPEPAMVGRCPSSSCGNRSATTAYPLVHDPFVATECAEGSRDASEEKARSTTTATATTTTTSTTSTNLSSRVCVRLLIVLSFL